MCKFHIFFKSCSIFKFTFRNSRYNETQKDSHSGRVNGKKGAITYETSKKTVCRGAVASLFCATVLAASLPALPAAAASTLAGDVNLDGSVNLSDAVAMQQYLLQERTLSAEAGANADYNAMAFARSLTWQ